jgi:hypothetical protein
MPSAVITPTAQAIGTSEAVAYTVPANEDDALDLIVSNATASGVTLRLGIGSGGVLSVNIVHDRVIDANDTVVIAKGLKLPAGSQILTRAGAAASLYLSVTGSKRSTL